MYAPRVLSALLVTTGTLGATVAVTSNAPIISTQGHATVRVQYGDLNLASAQGQKTLSQRIHQAVDMVCFQPDQRALKLWSEYRQCMQDATNSAWAQVRWSDTQASAHSQAVAVPAAKVR